MTADMFTSRYYMSPDGLRLHYRDYPGPSDAPFAVVCIPGLTRNARDYEDLAPHLAKKYRVICAELRGRGLSEYAKDPATYVPPVYVRDMVALIKSTGLRQVALIGTSLGGVIAMVLCGIFSAKILGVVLNDIGPEVDAAGLARIRGYLGKSKPITTWEDAAETIKMLDGTVYPEYQPADWLRMARRRFVQDESGAFRLDYDLNISKPFGGSTEAIDLWPYFMAMRGLPALAIRGGTSDLLSPEVFARMKQAMPDLTQVTVPSHGHAPSLDEPEALAGIDAFLAKLPHRLGIGTVIGRTLKSILFLAELKIKGVI